MGGTSTVELSCKSNPVRRLQELTTCLEVTFDNEVSFCNMVDALGSVRVHGCNESKRFGGPMVFVKRSVKGDN